MFSPNLSAVKAESFSEIKLYYGCDKCSFKTKLLSRLKSHANHKNIDFNCSSGLEPYKCHKCETFETQFLSQLRRHIVQGHVTQNVQPTNNKCPKCDFESFSKYLFLRHSLLTEHQTSRRGNRRIFKCTNCDYTSRDSRDLRRHVISKHTQDSEIEWLKCKHCPFKSKHKYNLKKHMVQKHDPNFRYSCQFCDYKSKMNYHLQRHLKRQHESKKNSDLLAFRHAIFTKHQIKRPEKGGVLKCTHCDYATECSYRLKRHLICRHTDDSEIQWLKCEHCPFKCKIKYQLKIHVVAKHTSACDIKYFQCDQCHFETKYKHSLQKHYNRHGANLNLLSNIQ
ncbi:zinc finger protein 711-like [Tribolium madens]|uniref:zinc finger protein 711-like n=1 Tax=Tribolium madens TaxID=41895 RepID=UPI001CF724F1|nr:zinc finger protein 711-like [Tribolium madens]